MKSINAIGVDIGYGYTKVCGERLSRVFPSQVTKLRPRGAFGSQPEIIIVNNQPFVVGDEIDSLGDFSFRNEFLGTPEYLALMGHALSLVKGYCDILVMGLPPGIYDEARVAKLEKAIFESKIRNSDGSSLPMPKAVRFIPQGAGIYYDYVNTLQQRSMQPPKTVAVIDLGSYTLDVVFYEDRRYITGAGRSYPLGISTLLKDIKAHFAKVHGTFLDNDENVLSLIREGSYTHFGRTYHLDVNPIVEEYINEKVNKLVYNWVTSDLRRKSVSKVLIGGGGVSCIGQFMKNDAVVIVDEPQMSNARGYYHFGRRQTEVLSAGDEKPETIVRIA
jgi:hypothetical protein